MTTSRENSPESDLLMVDLMHRECGDISCTLYWHRKTCTVSIALQAAGVNVAFIVEPQEAMEDFWHPFPAAGKRGLIDYEEQGLEGIHKSWSS